MDDEENTIGLEMVCPDCLDEDGDSSKAEMNAVHYDGAVFFVCVRHRETPLCCVSMDDLIFWVDGEPAKGEPAEKNMPGARVLH